MMRMKLNDISQRLYDISHYMMIPQWIITEEYNIEKELLKRSFPNEAHNYYQRKALINVYQKYEDKLLEGIDGRR